MPVPLLILSDAGYTGLARISRELATNIHKNMSDVFRVGVMGYGGSTDRNLPYIQYPVTVSNNYVLPELPNNWINLAGDEKGVVLVIWNAGWVNWLADPSILNKGPLRTFLEDKPFKKWLYCPIDGHGVNGTIPGIKDVLSRFDRVLAYTKYGAGVIDRTLEVTGTPHLPHGLDTSVFYPRDRAEARRTFVERLMLHTSAPLHESVFLMGICATNSPRKDWFLAFETCAELKHRGKQVGMWCHTDSYNRSWDLEALAKAFGMIGSVFFTSRVMTDDEMAWGYSSCDVILGIGSGEGWGYPLAESLACGTPVVHGVYAGGAEFVPSIGLVSPITYRGDGPYGIYRPVFRAIDWADVALDVKKEDAILPAYIDWKNAWPEWEKWLKAGVE